jgi:glycosyltransferase involved in cell wall biosynthesis
LNASGFPPTISVAVCVITYRRPVYLRELLQSLALLDSSGLAAQVIVVDNDASGSAQAVTSSFGPLIPNLIYQVEPERGISAARNRSVALASRDRPSYLAFIDDDETADPAWLRQLVQTAVHYGADAVGGPVLPVYEPGVPAWVIDGGFFGQKRHQTGAPVMLTGTNNLLLRRDWLEAIPGPFDRRFDLTGSGDSHLLHRLARLGMRMVWCDEAMVQEKVPLSRANVGWLVKRRLRVGMMAARRDCLLEPGPGLRLARARGALGELRMALGELSGSLYHGGQIERVRALRRCAHWVGHLLGQVGFSMQEYRQIHGR